MTVRQKKVYRQVLIKDYEALTKGKGKVSLVNIMMQLRKTCNHVELLQEPEEVSIKPEDKLKQLLSGSAKLMLLDKLLLRFKQNGDRVLVFSQMVMMLNLLENYMKLKRFRYQRLDGGVSADQRKQSIAQFNDPDSKDFCFLLSTKAGGLGLNLQTANRVIIFDSDWNPQNDLQAIARAHRIGQKQEVKIFRLVCSSSVDEEIIQRAKKKMVLDHLVIQTMDTAGTGENRGTVPYDKTELNLILKFGAEDLFKAGGVEEQDKELDLDYILQSAEVRENEETPQSEANRELLGSFKCTNILFGEEEEEGKEKHDKDWSDIIPSVVVEAQSQKAGVDGEDLLATRVKRRKRKCTAMFDDYDYQPQTTSEKPQKKRGRPRKKATEREAMPSSSRSSPPPTAVLTVQQSSQNNSESASREEDLGQAGPLEDRESSQGDVRTMLETDLDLSDE